MGTSDHEHDGDPYTSLPGEHQIPYSPRRRSVRTPRDPGPADRDVPAPHGRRHRLRPALLAAVAVMAVAGAGAAAVGLGVFPDGSTVTTGSGLEETTPEETETTETPEPETDSPSPESTEPESPSPESTEPESPSPTESVTDEPSPTPVPRDELSLGDCVDFEDGSLLAVDCDDLHEYEVIATPPSLSGTDYPGATLLSQDARLKCQREFSNFKNAYVGNMSLKLAYQKPNQRQWVRGEPVLCFVRNADGAYLEGSATDDAPDFP
ncbi:hypothetical protein GCM10010329_58420 [Streptomyces spiroverticillatus]|uniref:Septum formation-related domain-containing protein n=1 Tax=Streptomyces finlayi TaxID=67296 RepID=A0A918X3H5_9ACTN|nr:hypothetical protein [Streptomyces finlayi]GHA27495.1 hypothetical protein GCM10010329_58420 [Streptomyces spiroverticillatus]GHD08607.1 hypothetical protein GCM10010334_62080 [Streptomyces finlayi]